MNVRVPLTSVYATQGTRESLNERAGMAAALLKAMANRHRLMILCHLQDGERSVGALESQLDLSQSALSQHLAKLRQAGLVRTRREAQTIYYSLASVEARHVMTTLQELFGQEVFGADNAPISLAKAG